MTDSETRLKKLVDELQLAWNGFAKIPLRIIKEKDEKSTKILVEDIALSPILVSTGMYSKKRWGWRVERIRLIPGPPDCEDYWEYAHIEDCVNNDSAIICIVREISGKYAIDALLAGRSDT